MRNNSEDFVAHIELIDCTDNQSSRFFSAIRTRFVGVVGKVTKRESAIGHARIKTPVFTLSATCLPSEERGCFSNACNGQLDRSQGLSSNIFYCKNCPKNRKS
jgi:hypothetical protein